MVIGGLRTPFYLTQSFTYALLGITRKTVRRTGLADDMQTGALNSHVRTSQWHQLPFQVRSPPQMVLWVILKFLAYTVANAPSASDAGAGTIVYVSNGAAGSAILAFSDGTNWKRSDTGATISAS